MPSFHPQLSVHHQAHCPALPEGDLWVFGYGSLLWNPGFEYAERLPARLYGYHRALCVWSHVHRGTPEHPGMVLGLDRGGSCLGLAFRVPAASKQQVAGYLYAREMPTTVYRACFKPVRLRRGGEVHQALTFVVDRKHPQYAGSRPPEAIAGQVAHAQGISGWSRDYLHSTLEHLRALGLRDSRLEAIAGAVERHLAACPPAD